MNLTVDRLFERKCIGIMGMALPFLCWASCLLTPFKPSGWCDSMSATYYNSPVLSMGLALVAGFLFTYHGYDKADRVVNLISAVCAMIVALIPCSTEFTPSHVGILYLPEEISNLIHCIAAASLFISFVVNIMVNFTKGNSKSRNRCFYILGSVMGLMLIVFALSIILGFKMSTFWVEVFELELFGAAWLIKGRFYWNN